MHASLHGSAMRQCYIVSRIASCTKCFTHVFRKPPGRLITSNIQHAGSGTKGLYVMHVLLGY